MVSASPKLDVNNPFLQRIISEQRLKNWEFEQGQQREFVEKCLKEVSRSAIACKRYTRNVIEDHSRLLTEIDNVHKELNKLAEFDEKTKKLTDADKATWLTSATIMKASHSFAESHKEQRETFVTSIIEMQRLVLKILNFGVNHFSWSRQSADKNKCSFRDDQNCKLEQKKCRKTCLCSDCDSLPTDLSAYYLSQCEQAEAVPQSLSKNVDEHESLGLKDISKRLYDHTRVARDVLSTLQASKIAGETYVGKMVFAQKPDEQYPVRENEDESENYDRSFHQRKRRKTSYSEDNNNSPKREKTCTKNEKAGNFSTEALFPHLVGNTSLPVIPVYPKADTSLNASNANHFSSSSQAEDSANGYGIVKNEPEEDEDSCDGELKPEVQSDRGSIDMEIESESHDSDEGVDDQKDESPIKAPPQYRDEFYQRQFVSPNFVKDEVTYPTSSYHTSYYDRMFPSPKVTLNITPLSGDENDQGIKREKGGCPSSVTKKGPSDRNVTNIVGKRVVCSQTVPEANVESVLHAALKRPLATPKPDLVTPKVITPTLPGMPPAHFLANMMPPPPFPNPHMFMFMPGPPPPFPLPPWPYPGPPPPKNAHEIFRLSNSNLLNDVSLQISPPLLPWDHNGYRGHAPPYNAYSFPPRPPSRRHPEHETTETETNIRKH